MTLTSLARSSISAVCVVEDTAPDLSVIAELQSILSRHFADTEVVIVANGCADLTALHLKALTEQLPDIAVEFLATRIDRDSAALVGMENAVGDWVLLFEPKGPLASFLPTLFAETAEGNEVILGLPPRQWRRSWLRALFQRPYIKLYNWLNRTKVLTQRPVASLLSRAAALHVLHSPAGEMLLRAREIAAGFPSSVVTIAAADFAPPVLPFGKSLSKGARMLLAMSTTPLRFITLVGLAGSSVSLIYSVYVVFIYLFKSDVQPGWTTMSLQIALLTFLFSAMFALLAEYTAQIHAASSVRRRFFVVREIRSQRMRNAQRLNVIDGEGQFQLGAPVEPAQPLKFRAPN